MKEIGQRKKLGMESLSADKTCPWQQIGMYSCSAHLVFVLTHARWQTVWWVFFVRVRTVHSEPRA